MVKNQTRVNLQDVSGNIFFQKRGNSQYTHTKRVWFAVHYFPELYFSHYPLSPIRFQALRNYSVVSPYSENRICSNQIIIYYGCSPLSYVSYALPMFF